MDNVALRKTFMLILMVWRDFVHFVKRHGQIHVENSFCILYIGNTEGYLIINGLQLMPCMKACN